MCCCQHFLTFSSTVSQFIRYYILSWSLCATLLAIAWSTIETPYILCHLAIKQDWLPQNLDVYCKLLSHHATSQVLVVCWFFGEILAILCTWSCIALLTALRIRACDLFLAIIDNAPSFKVDSPLNAAGTTTVWATTTRIATWHTCGGKNILVKHQIRYNRLTNMCWFEKHYSRNGLDVLHISLPNPINPTHWAFK